MYSKEREALCKHPRLHFRYEDRALLLDKIANICLCAEGWQKIKEKADKYVVEDIMRETEFDAGTGQHGNYLQASSFAMSSLSSLGAAYFITQEEKYAKKAIEIMVEFCKWQKWIGPGFAGFDPPWNSSLETAHFTEAIAFGWDCFYDCLESNEKELIQSALVKKGILPLLDEWVGVDKRIHSMDSMGHNWWAVCIVGGALGAIALLGTWDEAGKYAGLAYDALEAFLKYEGSPLFNKVRTFNRDGGSYESVSYYTYPLLKLALFDDAYHRIFGKRTCLREHVQKGYEFYMGTMIENADGGIMHLGFGDNSQNPVAADAAVYLASMYDNSYMQWYVHRVYDSLESITSILRYDPEIPQQSPNDLPLTMCNKEIGWLITRTGWQRDDTVFGIKAGHTWGHAHADAGSFFLYHGGVPLAVDSGMCTYSDPLYWEYFVRTRAHNTVTIGGKGQSEIDILQGSKNDGKIIAHLDTPLYKYALVDVQGPYSHLCRRFYRSVLWIDNLIAIFDEIQLNSADTLEWLLHYEGTGTIGNSEFDVVNSGMKLSVRNLHPDSSNYSLDDGHLCESYGGTIRSTPYLKMAMPATDRHKMITLLQYGKERDFVSVPIKRIEEDLILGFTMSSSETCLSVIMNHNADGRKMHQNAIVSHDGIYTDAYMVTFSQDFQSFGVHHGSFLRFHDKPLFSSYVPVHLVRWGDIGECMRIINSTAQAVWVSAPKPPSQVLINGEAADFIYDSITGCAKFRLGTGEFLITMNYA